MEQSASPAFSRCEESVGRESGSICWSNPVQVVLSAPIRGGCDQRSFHQTGSESERKAEQIGDTLLTPRLQENHPGDAVFLTAWLPHCIWGKGCLCMKVRLCLCGLRSRSGGSASRWDNQWHLIPINLPHVLRSFWWRIKSRSCDTSALKKQVNAAQVHITFLTNNDGGSRKHSKYLTDVWFSPLKWSFC